MIAITPVVLLIMPVRLHVLERMVRVSHTQTGAHLTLTICNVGDGIWLSGTPHQGCGVRLLHRWSPNRSPFMRFAVPIMAFISRSVNSVRISCCPGMGQTLSGWGSGSSITQLLMDMWICRACVHADVVRHMIGEVLMGVISACGMRMLALSFVIGKVSLISINIIFGSMVVFIVHVFIGETNQFLVRLRSAVATSLVVSGYILLVHLRSAAPTSPAVPGWILIST